MTSAPESDTSWTWVNCHNRGAGMSFSGQLVNQKPSINTKRLLDRFGTRSAVEYLHGILNEKRIPRYRKQITQRELFCLNWSVFLKMGQLWHLLSFIFGLFNQTSLQFYSIYMWKMSIQYTVPGFEHEHEFPAITTRPGLPQNWIGQFVDQSLFKNWIQSTTGFLRIRS